MYYSAEGNIYVVCVIMNIQDVTEWGLQLQKYIVTKRVVILQHSLLRNTC
jgi:hypothetical protein